MSENVIQAALRREICRRKVESQRAIDVLKFHREGSASFKEYAAVASKKIDELEALTKTGDKIKAHGGKLSLTT